MALISPLSQLCITHIESENAVAAIASINGTSATWLNRCNLFPGEFLAVG
ncbi:hypothetical protein [Coleofasciculus sp. B1-GNL1-01]